MRASKARAGLRAGKPCHRRWSAYGTSREYREAPSHTRGGSRMPDFGPYGSVRGARGNSRPYRDQRSEADIRNTKVPCLEKDQTMNLRSKVVPTPTTKKPRDIARGYRYLMPVGQNL